MRQPGRRSRPRALAHLLLLLVALGCYHVSVTTRTRPGADFSGLTSFAQEASDRDADAAVAARVQSEIARVMEAKGYAEAPLDSADMVVAFRGSGKSRERLEDAGDPDADFYVVQDYIEGTLVIEVFAHGGETPLWHGTGEVDVSTEANLEKAAAKAVEAVLKDFPARP